MHRQTLGTLSAPARAGARRVVQGVAVALSLATLLSASPAALAEQASAADGTATRVSASIDFRIVIPETVRFVQGQEQHDRTRQYTSRTVEVVDGQQVLTIARP
jgi:hypothetical protein